MKLELLHILRIRQWLKNLMLFFPPLLAGGHYSLTAWGWGGLAFFSFSLVSSATYIINDLRDIEADRNHPVKCKRPLASGKLSKGLAKRQCVLALACGFGGSIFLPVEFFGFLLAYIVLSLVYTFYFKHQPVFDICSIALLFILRLYSGGTIFAVEISPWLFLSVFLLALYLSAGKRLSEQVNLERTAAEHRPSLASYPVGMLDGVIVMTGASVLVTYALYAISHGPLIYSVPVCAFGLLRYLLRVKQGADGDPTASLLSDVPLLITGVVWTAMVGWSIYL